MYLLSKDSLKMGSEHVGIVRLRDQSRFITKTRAPRGERAMSSLSTDPSILRPITQIQTGISDRTETCQSLFSRCVSNTAFSDENLDWYESRQGEFNLWASILKATDIGRSSLDYRLQDDDELRGRICGLLEGLSESLKTLLQPGMRQHEGTSGDMTDHGPKIVSRSPNLTRRGR